MSSGVPIDPELRRFLDEQAKTTTPLFSLPEDQRVAVGRKAMLRAVETRTEIPRLPNGVKTEDLSISPHLSAHLFVPPEPPAALPVMVYLHGGGWVNGSPVTHDPFCRLLSEAARLSILSVDYRRAPEHPFPAGLNDARTALDWAGLHAGEWGGDPSLLAIGGDSSGGNLAAVTANRYSRDGAVPALSAQMLLYPVIDHPSANHSSFEKYATGYGLEANLMRWFWEQYAGQISPSSPDISPLREATLPQLPPTLVATAEFDVLRDEGVAYAEKLAQSGTPVRHLHAADMHHVFPVHPALVMRFRQSAQTLDEIAAWLRKVFEIESLPQSSATK